MGELSGIKLGQAIFPHYNEGWSDFLENFC